MWGRKRILEDLDQEIRDHIERETQDNVERGLSLEEARYMALRKFGNTTRVKEDVREVWSLVWLERLLQDIGIGLRMLRKNSGFTAIAVLILALGIGANTAIFSLLYGLVLRDLPVAHPSELVRINMVVPGNQSISALTWGMYQQILTRQHSFSGMSAWGLNAVAAQDKEGNFRTYQAMLVSGEGFQVLGVRPYLGRLLDASDDVRGGPAQGWSTVLSYGFWNDRFGGDPGIVGKQIRSGERFLTVVGVTPPDFQGVMPGLNPQLYVPFQIHSVLDSDSQDLDYGCHPIARLKPEVSMAQATAELKTYQDELFDRFLPPELKHTSAFQGASIEAISAGRGLPWIRDRYTQPLVIMQSLVGVVLLLCCVNVGGLMVSKTYARQREFATRKALGGSRWRLIRQCLIESLLIAITGAAFGGFAARFGSAVLLNFFVDPNMPEGLNVHPDATEFLVAGGLAICSTILFGIVPAWHASLSDPGNLLSSRSTSGGRRNLAGRTFVPVQVGLSLVLVTIAALLSQSLARIQGEYAGFDGRHVTSQWPLLYQHLPQRGDAMLDVYQKMVDRLKQFPGVQSAAIVGASPMGSDDHVTSEFQTIGGRSDFERTSLAFNLVGAGYFQTMQTPVLAGREFEYAERNSSVCIANQSAATYLFPNGEAIGQLVKSFDTHLFPKEPCRIIGITEDAKYADFRQPAPRMIFYPVSNKAIAAYGNLTFLVRGPRQADVVTAFREAASEIIPTVPLNRFATIQQQIDERFGSQRLITVMSDFFGGLALLLSAIGLYGLLSSNVTQRTAEMGIRMALGARRASVLLTILKEALILFALGIGFGGILLWATGRSIGAMLYHIPAFEPITLAGSILLLAATALLAAFIPAHRASRVDPVVALRCEQ